MEAAIDKAKSLRKEEADRSLWKHSDCGFKQCFVKRKTLRLLQTAQPVKTWFKGVWFTHTTPKYPF